MKNFTPLFAAALVSGVSGHAFFQEVHVNGVSAGHNFAIRQAASNSPIEDVDSANVSGPELICRIYIPWHLLNSY